MPPRLDEASHKQRIFRELSQRFFLRFHTFILIAWTFLAGLLTTKFLWWAELDVMWLRYTLAVLVAYCAFLIGVRAWLAYVDLGRHTRRRDSVDGPWIDIPSSGSGSKGDGHCDVPRGGGGQYGGGGSSGHYGSVEISSPEAAGELAEASVSLANGTIAGMGEAAGAAGEGCLPVIAMGAILAVLVGAFGLGAYIAAEAPMVLVEAAFEAMLAGGLLRTRRWAGEADWMHAVFRYTWKTLLAVLAAAWAFSFAVAHYIPEARDLTQVISILLAR